MVQQMDSVGFIQLRWKYQLLILTGGVASAEAVPLLCFPLHTSCSPPDWQSRDSAECHSIIQPLHSLHATWVKIFSVRLRKVKVATSGFVTSFLPPSQVTNVVPWEAKMSTDRDDFCL